jgi:cytidylate kinase
MTNGQIAIDGPAASGKSTVARLAAKRLGGYYINTGDMYRCVTRLALDAGIDPKTQPQAVAGLLERIDLNYAIDENDCPQLELDGSLVPQERIRGAEVAALVSYTAKIPEVRTWLVERQRESRKLGLVVMEGRDIGTVVFPDAPFKFFVTASPLVRARRRLAQAGETEAGATVESVAASIAERDRIDSTRAVSPLKPAADARLVNTDELTPDQVVDIIVQVVQDAEK